jgi:hypothetical protein
MRTGPNWSFVMIRLVFATLAACTFAGPALAADVLSSFEGAPCYGRTYDAEHLAGHPDQLTSNLDLRTSPYVDPTGETVLRLSLWLRDGKFYMTDVYCDGKGDIAGCFAEGDGGAFTLTMSGDDVRMELTQSLIIEGEFNFSPDLSQSDDRVFLLHRGECS